MNGVVDPIYVAARATLLDAIEALEATSVLTPRSKPQ
jgi:hypothetical protein